MLQNETDRQGDWTGRIILVTGAGNGIGEATARLLASVGATVVVSDIDANRAQSVTDSIQSDSGSAVCLPVDVREEPGVAALIDDIIATFGRLDGAYNNAGVEDYMKPAAELSGDEWSRVIGTDLTGTWLCLKYELEAMVEQGYGSIVNAASVLGHVAMANVPAYTAAKHGVVGLTRSAAIDYAARGIRVNAVSAGAIRTELVARTIDSGLITEDAYAAIHPMRRLGTPEEVAEAVVWLLSGRSSFVTGHCLAVDGGMLAT